MHMRDQAEPSSTCFKKSDGGTSSESGTGRNSDKSQKMMLPGGHEFGPQLAHTHTQHTRTAAAGTPRPTTPHQATPTTPNQERTQPVRDRTKPTPNATKKAKQGYGGESPLTRVGGALGITPRVHEFEASCLHFCVCRFCFCCWKMSTQKNTQQVLHCML